MGSSRYVSKYKCDISLGASIGEQYTVTVTGSEGSVLDQTGVDLIGPDGVTVNALGCAPEWAACFGGSAQFDPDAENGTASSASWQAGAGEGIDVSVDILKLSDYVVYASKETGIKGQIPFLNKNFTDKVFKNKNEDKSIDRK